jgi:hypothetical protein
MKIEIRRTTTIGIQVLNNGKLIGKFNYGDDSEVFVQFMEFVVKQVNDAQNDIGKALHKYIVSNSVYDNDFKCTCCGSKTILGYCTNGCDD